MTMSDVQHTAELRNLRSAQGTKRGNHETEGFKAARPAKGSISAEQRQRVLRYVADQDSDWMDRSETNDILSNLIGA